MAHAHTVLESYNLQGNAICVDIFQRPDGTYGFDEFRRDSEDGRGWFSIGHHGHQVFASADDARRAAVLAVGWLDSELPPAKIRGA